MVDIKGLYENEETAVKLLKENVELKNKIEDLEAEIENLKFDVEHWKEKCKDIEQDRDENYRAIPVKWQVE